VGEEGTSEVIRNLCQTVLTSDDGDEDMERSGTLMKPITSHDPLISVTDYLWLGSRIVHEWEECISPYYWPRVARQLQCIWRNSLDVEIQAKKE
jgi:hypothetical protein